MVELHLLVVQRQGEGDRAQDVVPGYHGGYRPEGEPQADAVVLEVAVVDQD